MAHRPACVLFDVIGTLFSLDAVRDAFAARALPPLAADLWFQRTLRDGFALAVIGRFVPFADVATETLAVVAAEQGWQVDRRERAALVATMSSLTPHADVEPAFQLLAQRGVAIVALTNGSRAATEKLLSSARLDGYVRQVISIDDARAWKPRRELYLYAAAAVGLPPPDVALVAAHAWDVHGARRAGLLTGWVSRPEQQFHGAMQPADVRGASLLEVARTLVALPLGSDLELRP